MRPKTKIAADNATLYLYNSGINLRGKQFVRAVLHARTSFWVPEYRLDGKETMLVTEETNQAPWFT